jgi:GNAT superfamily N-acetyltransferase
MGLVVEHPNERAGLTDLVTFHDDVYRSRGAWWGAFVPFQLPVLTGESPFVAGRRFHPLRVRDGRHTLARVVAVIDERYQRHWGEEIGHLVMFEALPDTREAVRLLMDAACEWLAGHGATAARAGSGVLEFPFVIDAYDALPPSWLRQNPAYYHGLLKDAGFETEKGFVDYRVRVRPELVARWESAVEAARRAGYELVPLRELSASRRAREFTTLWNESFARHWGFTPFSEDEMALLLETFAPLGMLDLSTFAVDREGVVGGVWVVPDMSGFAHLAPGRTLQPAERLNVLGIGVRERARGRGVNMAVAAHAYLELVRRGATHVSYTLVLDDNWPSRRTAEKLGAEVCASYVAYRRELRPRPPRA